MIYQSYKFRPSEIGSIMAGYSRQGLTDKQQVTLDDLIAKGSKSQLRSELEAKRDAPPSLSSGGVTYVRNIVRQQYLEYSDRIETRQMDKGLQCEELAIAEINRNEFTNYEKFPEGTYQNDWIVSIGCDIKQGRMTRDIKCSWSKKTHPLTKSEAYNTDYYWQGQSYMWLFDADEHHLDHVLLTTPDELIGYESPMLHDCDDLPWTKRYLTYRIERDPSAIDSIPDAIRLARIEMDRYYAEIHGL